MGTTNGSGSTPKKEISVERELPVQLTEKELLERGALMSEAELEIEALKLKRQEVNTVINAKVKTRATLAHTIDTGVEKRTVLCKWVKNFVQNCWQLVRQDTFDIAEEKPLSAADRQSSIEFPEDDFVPEELVAVGSETVDFGSGKKPKAPKTPKVTKFPKLSAPAKTTKPKSTPKKSGRSSRQLNA